MKGLWGYLKKYKWYTIFAPLFKLIESILELLSPLLVAKIIDIGVINKDFLFIGRYALIILAVNVIALVFSILGQKFSSKTSVGVSTDMRADLYRKITSFSHTELDKFGTASIINRMSNDITQVENAISICMRLLLRVPCLLIGAFILSLIINPIMSVIFLVLIPIVVVILWIYMKKTSPHFKLVRDKLDAINRVTKENLSGTRVIRAFNKQQDEQKRFEAVTEDYSITSIHISKISALLQPLVMLIVDAAIIAILYFGGVQVNVGGMTQGNVIALIDYVSMITISLLLMSHIIVMFVRTNASLHRINEIMSTVPVVDMSLDKRFKDLSYDALMEFNNVYFNYSGDIKNVSFIKDLSFKIYPNQTIGIIGGTGSGKTTIANLMTRFYDVTQGEILYKGKNIKEYSLQQLRNEVSVVQQRSTLFSGSLRENMQIRNANATDEEIIEALKISQAWPFVSEWNNKLDHQIMAGGKNVSGGQMQRLTIARSIIGNPELLILDDSSSALDFLTDSKLRKALKTLNSTLVIISQRATSIKNCDLIIVLDNGDVVGMGKHASLMKNCEIYKEIYESQAK